jgi:hypothetical protein
MLALALFSVGIERAEATAAASVGSDFLYTFNSWGTLYEAGSMENSTSPYFWVNSGGKLLVKGGVGGTVQGELVGGDPTRLIYAKANPLDTDNGFHPQNIFRLLTRSTWGDAAQEVAFRITEQNLSNSPNRQGHNGVLLMNRYRDQHNLYYAGIRNDGIAIIKKKVNGSYYTLASVQIFGLRGKYDRASTPSLLPLNRWMRLKTEVMNQWDGSVRIRLLLDRENDGTFVSILAANDYGVGGAPLRSRGHTGIRTDFMDVEFENYRINEL